MAKVKRSADIPGFATYDQSEGARYSVLGPQDANGEYAVNGDYVARDHEDDLVLGRGTRDNMITLVEGQGADELS